MTLHTTSVTLAPTAPFDFGKSLAFLCSFAPTQAEQLVTSKTLTKSIRTAGQTVVFLATASGTVEEPALDCTLFSAQPLATDALNDATDRIAFYLSLYDDLAPFYALGREDQSFAQVVDNLYGYHQVKFSSPFENACWAILVQRLPMPMAQKMKTALMEHFSNYLTVDGNRYCAFPDIKQLASCTEAELKRLIGNERKAQYLFGVAQAFADVDEQFLRVGPYEEVKHWLLSLRGIGDWSASFILIRGLGRTEEVPPDKALLQASAKIYRTSFSQQQFQDLASRYQRWQGYWAHYLRVSS